MFRFCALMLACTCGLALGAGPARAKEPKQRADQITEVPDPPELLLPAMLDALHKQKVEIDGSKIGAESLTAVLQKLAKKHNITFVILEDEFKARKIADIRDQKSRVKQLDTNDMTVAELLDVWLPGLRATYKIHPDYVAVVPLPAKVAEPAPVLKLRKDEPNPKDDPKPAKKLDPAEAVLAGLAREVNLGDQNVNDIPLFELLQGATKKSGLTFTINEDAFKQLGNPNIRETRPNLAVTQLRGISLRQFLNITLDSLGATYLLRNGTIEVVPLQFAAKVTKSATSEGEDGRVRLTEPLVSAVLKEKPLNEVVAQIAEMYDLTVVVSPQAGDARTGFVTARLLNVPADKALELLALQCDLRVVRRGAAFLITSRDHANELFDENLERQRKKIELQKLREAPTKPPPAQPEKPPVLIPRQEVPVPARGK
jgi:hypothetical protein